MIKQLGPKINMFGQAWLQWVVLAPSPLPKHVQIWNIKVAEE